MSSGQLSIGKGRLDKVSIDKGREEKENQAAPVSFYGEYQNVRLTEVEYHKLKDKLQSHTDTMIEKLSRYIKSSGKDYKDHYVTILNWYEEDKDKLRHQGGNKKMNYDVGESL